MSEQPFLLADARSPDLPVIYASPAFERLTGWAAGQMVGKNCRVLQHEAFNQPGRWLMRDAIRRGSRSRALVQNWTRDGQAFVNEVTLLPIGSPGQSPDYYLGFQRNLTSRDDTGPAREGPRIADERRDEGLRDCIAHLERAFGTVIDATTRRWLTVAATPSGNITEGGLDAVREDDDPNHYGHPFSLDDLIVQIRRRAGDAAPGVPVQVTREPRFPERIFGCQQALVDTLGYVISALLRFSPLAEIRIDLSLELGNGEQGFPRFAIFPVPANGDQPEPISGSEGPDKALSPWSDLAFPEVARQVALCGARLWLEPDFTFHLRLSTPVNLAAAQYGAGRFRQRHLKVLVGEDNPVNWKMLTGLLQHQHHEVRVAESGVQVLDALQDGRPDVLFLDLYMPGLDGTEVAAQIREEERREGLPRLPIIAVSAATEPEEQGRCLAAGIDAFIGKPVDREHLQAVLWEVLGNRPGDGEGSNGKPVSLADHHDLELDQALQALDYDLDLFAGMLDAFRADFPERMGMLRNALRKRDVTEAGFIAHTLKGALSNFNAAEAVGLANALGDQIGRGQVREARETLKLLDETVQRFMGWADESVEARRREHRKDRTETRATSVDGRSVLVVEDSADTRLMLTEFLRRDGYVVHCASNGEEALSQLAVETPDLILMDCVMPVMDGLEACRRIKSHDAYADVPLLIITALNDESSAGEAIRAGATDFITKPIFLPVLRQRLRQLVLSRERHQRIRYLAYHDNLTGLPNRARFHQELDELLQSAQERGGEHALMYLDLDQFKIVNDTCGHAAGDELLKELGEVLTRQVRNGDLVARLGGDEFGVLLRDCRLENGVLVAEKIIDAVRNFVFFWEEQAFFIGASAGVVAINDEGSTTGDLLSAADTACYAAKSSGRGRVEVYRREAGQVRQESEQLQLVPRITRALEGDRFVLYRQRIVSLCDVPDHVPHYEVLVRMLDEDGTIVPPARFIPSAERYQVMPRVDRWVVRHALKHLREEHLQGGQPVRYSINLSGTTLIEKGFGDFLEEQVSVSGVPPEWLCFEITETATIRQMDAAVAFINRIRSLGCTFALDDFGAGLSSFGYLKTLPVDFIKIDGRFVRDLLEETFDQAMVEAIQRIGSVMGIETIAEFVENEAVMERLREIGVTYAQGYGIHRPEPFPGPLEASA
ncbi:EAL domain-containing protein [Aquisalimonas sp.]|uniref:EAL domain-containing protein n=1 Tax=unclassified Aquisalimonas TaxID=2644645 RepID=UPI0025C3157E|nr:EAL domain-containing protein [Aquisalimonas sp.]